MKVLVAEDDRDIALLYRVALEDRNHDAVITYNGKDCLAIYLQELRNFISRLGFIDYKQQQAVDIVILDYKMPGINGIEVAKEIITINPKQRIVIASAHPEETFFYSIKNLGHMVEFMRKPFHLDTLIDTIEPKQFLPRITRPDS
jgi:CheY-like chemotaxis protein